MNSLADTLKRLRVVAWLEGISFLLLLLVAMPLKYFASLPEAVFYTGMAHGLLFVLFTLTTFQAKIEYGWSNRRTLRVWVTSLVPLGMVWFDRMLQSPEEAEAG